ncbi:MAG: hypothetical protein ACJ8DK_05660 [Microvirga sp.]
MHTALKVAAAAAALIMVPLIGNHAAEAGKAEGVGIGAGVGAVVAGPVGAVVGGVAGYAVGGPNIFTGSRRTTCWRDHNGRRHCRRR